MAVHVAWFKIAVYNRAHVSCIWWREISRLGADKTGIRIDKPDFINY